MPEELKRTAENKPEYAPPDIVPLGRLDLSEGQGVVCQTGASNTSGACFNGGVNTGPGEGAGACQTGGLNVGYGCATGTFAP